MNSLKIVKPQTDSEKRTKTVVDTILVTPEIVKRWLPPPFQRPVKENEKVRALAEDLKREGGVWPGIITLGVLEGKVYIVDGQHRALSFILSGLEEGYTDVRTHYFGSLAAMGEEFVQLNSQLVRMRPDDILRGLEPSLPALAELRKNCPFVGYDQFRRRAGSPIVSMSMLLRCWRGSMAEVPAVSGGEGAQVTASKLTEEEYGWLTDFLQLAIAAWGRDAEYLRLWSSVNMIICMWLYRRLVLTQYSGKTPRLTKDLFKKCLMSLSVESLYLDWLVGRQMGERDRSPAYARVKSAFAARLFTELGKKVMLPSPPWSVTH